MTTYQTDVLTKTLGELATELAGATRVFRQYKLDFCCGGNIRLQEALLKKNIASGPVVAELSSLTRASATGLDWTQQTPARLVEHIYLNYHQLHRDQLPELVRLARRVEAVHGAKPDCPNGLADALVRMSQELESHMQKEEQILFPLLREGHIQHAQGPIHVMELEHVAHGDALDHVLALANDCEPPVGACNTWRALYSGLDAFRNDLIDHIHLENNILFKTPA